MGVSFLFFSFSLYNFFRSRSFRNSSVLQNKQTRTFLNVFSENSDKENKVNECDVRIGVVNRRRNVEKGLVMFRNEIKSNRDRDKVVKNDDSVVWVVLKV